MNINAFYKMVETHQVENSLKEEKAMEVLAIVEYSSAKNVGEVDFSKFTLEQCKMALDHVMYYEADEVNEEGNTGNLLNEINRLAHLRSTVRQMRSPKKRRFF